MYGIIKAFQYVEEIMIIQCALVDDSLNDIQIIKNTIFHLCYGTGIMIQVTSFQNPTDGKRNWCFALETQPDH